MYPTTSQGKCICVSFPLHELNLIEDLDRLAHGKLLTRSQYLRRLIRQEKQQVQVWKRTSRYQLNFTRDWLRQQRKNNLQQTSWQSYSSKDSSIRNNHYFHHASSYNQTWLWDQKTNQRDSDWIEEYESQTKESTTSVFISATKYTTP